MAKIVTPENGKSENINKAIENAKMKFPVTFQLKAVMDSASTDNENQAKLSFVLENLKIKNKYISNNKSSKGNYISYNYQVTLINKLQLETLYIDLKKVPGLKFAL